MKNLSNTVNKKISEGSLTYCDTGHPCLLWSSARARDTHTYCRAFGSGGVTTCFYDLGLSRRGFEHPTFRSRGERSNPLPHRRGSHHVSYILMGTRILHITYTINQNYSSISPGAACIFILLAQRIFCCSKSIGLAVVFFFPLRIAYVGLQHNFTCYFVAIKIS